MGKRSSSAGEAESVAAADKRCVYIVVLGDIGRSPRIRYHALSLANEGFLVQLIGYGGTPLPAHLAQNSSIWTRTMAEPPDFLQELPKLLAYPLKVVWQWLFLSWAFFYLIFANRFIPSAILVQNPPAIPTLGLCWAYSKIFRCPFIIDWHNYGFSIMSLKTSPEHPIVRFAKWFEDYFGSRGDSHICVTRAMKDDLKIRLNIDATTLYDRPPDIFKSLTKEARLEFLKKLAEKYPVVEEVVKSDDLSTGRPGILISTTSWTEDEDFSILLSALQEYEASKQENPVQLPKLIVFITGKGPQKEYYSNIINSLKLEHVNIYLPWLEHEDYPKILACSDLGVSLHTSSSGLDLPMKVVDMFGSGLPVCAMNFKCISELVKDNENGLIFNNASELSKQIQDWFQKTKTPNPNHKLFRQNIKAFQEVRWDENWKFNVRPLFKGE